MASQATFVGLLQSLQLNSESQGFQKQQSQVCAILFFMQQILLPQRFLLLELLRSLPNLSGFLGNRYYLDTAVLINLGSKSKIPRS